jgi:hypothetical protein
MISKHLLVSVPDARHAQDTYGISRNGHLIDQLQHARHTLYRLLTQLFCIEARQATTQMHDPILSGYLQISPSRYMPFLQEVVDTAGEFSIGLNDH